MADGVVWQRQRQWLSTVDEMEHLQAELPQQHHH